MHQVWPSAINPQSSTLQDHVTKEQAPTYNRKRRQSTPTTFSYPTSCPVQPHPFMESLNKPSRVFRVKKSQKHPLSQKCTSPTGHDRLAVSTFCARLVSSHAVAKPVFRVPEFSGALPGCKAKCRLGLSQNRPKGGVTNLSLKFP